MKPLIFLFPSLKLTYPLKIDPWKRRFLLETIIFRGELLVSGRVWQSLFGDDPQNQWSFIGLILGDPGPVRPWLHMINNLKFRDEYRYVKDMLAVCFFACHIYKVFFFCVVVVGGRCWTLRRCSSTVCALKTFDLAQLLAPVSLEEFRQRFFEQQALHITRPRWGKKRTKRRRRRKMLDRVYRVCLYIYILDMAPSQ